MDDHAPPKPRKAKPKNNAGLKMLPEAERKRQALQSVKTLNADTVSTVVAAFNQTPAPSNRNVTDEHMETVLARVAAGQTVKAVCTELQISAALVRQRAYDHPEIWGVRLREARALGADQAFDEMLEVARDTSLETARARLIADVLEKHAKVHNRATYGDKVQVDQRQIVINYDPDKHGGFI